MSAGRRGRRRPAAGGGGCAGVRTNHAAPTGNLRLNFYVAGALTLAGIAWFVRSQRKGKRAAQGTAPLAVCAILAGATAGCGQASREAQAASTPYRPAIAGHSHPSTHG